MSASTPAGNTGKSFPAVGPLGRLSALMCVVVAVGGALAELALAWVWLSPDLIGSLVAPRLGLTVPVALDGPTRLAGFAVSMIPMAVLLYMLHQAFQLFDAYRQGDVFTDMSPVRLSRIGVSMIALAIVRPLAGAMLTAVLTHANPPGQRVVMLGIGLDDYLLAALGGLVLAIGLVMVEAKRIADDHRQIV